MNGSIAATIPFVPCVAMSSSSRRKRTRGALAKADEEARKDGKTVGPDKGVGKKVVDAIEALGSQSGKVSKTVTIADSGELPAAAAEL